MGECTWSRRYQDGIILVSKNPSHLRQVLLMTIPNQAIFAAALALPEAERALLVERLHESLSPEPEEITDDELFGELERRRAEVEQGLVEPIPWSEVRLEE